MARTVLRRLELANGRRIVAGRTLLFLDEVQACPRAIMALRYFYEQVPELHVIAAGSLLELEVSLQLRDHPLVCELQAHDIPTEPYAVFRTETELADTPWLLLDICDHGIILFDPRTVLSHKLASLRLRLRELGSRRVELADGSSYWDLKPDMRPGEVITL